MTGTYWKSWVSWESWWTGRALQEHDHISITVHSTQYTVTPVSCCILTSISGFLPARLSVQGRQVHLSLPTRHKYAESDYNSLFCISYLLIYDLSIHTHLGAHWPWWPFMSLHSWESHITLESWKSTFTLRSTDHQLNAERDEKNLKNQWDLCHQCFQ